jgi:hypothetical protein
MPLYPPVLLNDLQLYQPNNDEYDREQVFAVVGYSHQYQAAGAGRKGITRTTIQGRRNPLAAYREYRRSVIPQVLVSTTDIDPALWAPEGTVHFKVDSLAPPVMELRPRVQRRQAARPPSIGFNPNSTLVVAGQPVAV